MGKNRLHKLHTLKKKDPWLSPWEVFWVALVVSVGFLGIVFFTPYGGPLVELIN